MSRYSLVLAIGLLSLLAMLSQARAQYTFSLVDFPGAADTILHGINDDGVVVGQYGDIDPGVPPTTATYGFVFDGTTFETVNVPGSLSSAALGINDGGQIVGVYRHSSGELRGFFFDGETYEDIVSPFAPHAQASDINNAGQIVGIYSNDLFASDTHGFVLEGETYESFDYPGASRTFLLGVNDLGQRAGTFISGLASAGFRAPELVTISHPEGLLTSVSGINDQGDLVGIYTSLVGFEARMSGFLYSSKDQTYRAIPFPGSDCTFNPLAPHTSCFRSLSNVNSAGAVVGYFDNDDGVLHGFIARPQHLEAGDADQDLDFDQLDLIQVSVAAKYLSGGPATWGEGDWDGAPGGYPGNPPLGDGLFNQLDIVAALNSGVYLTGLYAADQSSAIPVAEPASIFLLCLGQLVFALRQTRRSR